MPSRASKDPNETAFAVLQQATDPDAVPDTRNPAAVALAALGAAKGGRARAAALTPTKRRAIAKAAAAARWGKKR